jgi:large subunit ribosomal protein L9
VVKYNVEQAEKGRIMKVVFLEDVPNVGRAGEIKEVKNGYGRNYLIPKNLAVPAGSQAMNTIESRIASRQRLAEKTEAELAELGAQIDGREIFIEARSGGKERLYGSITNADIAAELEKVVDMAVDKRKIKLEESINQIGSYDVTVRLTKDITPTVKVTVTAKSE